MDERDKTEKRSSLRRRSDRIRNLRHKSSDRDKAYGRKGRSKVKRDQEREDSSSHSHKRKERDVQDNEIRVSEERNNIRAIHHPMLVLENQLSDAAASFQDTASDQNEGTSALRSPSSTSINGLPEAQPAVVTPEELEELKGMIEGLNNKLDTLEAKERLLRAKIAKLEQITHEHSETMRYIFQFLQIPPPFVLPPRSPPSGEDDTEDHSYDTGSHTSDTQSF